MTLGITIGKFYPFHLGHHYLIEQAKAQVDHLVVLVGYKPTQAIPGTVRANWIRFLHPDVEVIEVLEDISDAPQPWAERALAILQGRQPDFAFTSEAYGEPWAALMGAEHYAIDLQRTHFPISGTQLRQDLSVHWHMLTPPAKAYFAKRICVIGVESSGTTTLAQSLAKHYQTVWVPEYGRGYWEGRRYTPQSEQWDTYEFVQIAKGQANWEDDLAMRSNRLLICDTDPLATHVWHRRYTGTYAKAVEQIADSRDYDLYILTAPDFAFVQDGTREGEHIRLEMHQWFVEALKQKGKRYITVEGCHEERMSDAVAAIAPLLVFPILDAP
ncbi:MAG: AAA family ATPase [Oscillatoriophycideae cyanobacterium NC_groundwater_1537_Pr4_S-0.65um_50_18]|nr:AAA family ATPase [Oscillatoriophycideae cyanobacterium NC_groundwater_1537_Pr4_S-0.65um_50_18]